MELFIKAFHWLLDPVNWSGAYGVPHRVLEHLGYTALTVMLASLVAIPLGLYIGHTRRAAWLVSVFGALRSLPTLGVLTYLVLVAGNGLLPPIAALVVLAVPSILAGTYSGVASVGKDTVDAARAMGHTPWQIVTQVEVPNALPVILGGIRAAVLQVIATATVAAYINLGGVGRFLIDGLAMGDYPRMLAGSVVIALLALAADAALAGVERLVVSPGLRAAGNKSLKGTR